MQQDKKETPPIEKWYGGCQYDQVILSIGDEAQTVHQDRQPTEPQKSGEQQSGKQPDVMNNIYDLEGNYYEWTAEADLTDLRTRRGGFYNSASGRYWDPASYRLSSSPTLTSGSYSARPALYVNL